MSTCLENTLASIALERDSLEFLEDNEYVTSSLESRVEQLELLSSISDKPIYSSEQIALIDKITASVVQDTDLDMYQDIYGRTAQQVNVSLENGEGFILSTEAIGSVVKDMVKVAIEKLKEVGKWLYELCLKVINLFTFKTGRAEDVLAKVKELKKTNSKLIKPSVRLTGSQINTVRDGKEFSILFSKYTALSKNLRVVKAFLDEAEKVAKDLVTDHDARHESLAKLAGLSKDVVNMYSNVLKLNFKEENGQDVAVSTMVGDTVLRVTRSRVTDRTMASVHETNVQIKDVVPSMKFTSFKETSMTDSRTVPVIDLDTLEDLAKGLIEACGKEDGLENTAFSLVANHSIFKSNFYNKVDTNHTTKVNSLSLIVRDLALSPVGLLLTILSSVSEDYLRFAEQCVSAYKGGNVKNKKDSPEEGKEGESDREGFTVLKRATILVNKLVGKNKEVLIDQDVPVPFEIEFKIESNSRSTFVSVTKHDPKLEKLYDATVLWFKLKKILEQVADIDSMSKDDAIAFKHEGHFDLGLSDKATIEIR